MSEITKKLSAVVLTLALALSVNVGLAAEPTVDDLQAQIAELQELIATLQAQLKGGSQVTTPGTVPAVCAGVSFNRNLSLGASGSDVKCLQALLNTDATTQVAASGAGSKGAETEYFGTLTRTAVIAFQNKYASEVLTPLGLTAGTGIVGVQTRVKLNAMLTAGVPGETTPGETPGTSTPSETGVEGDLRIKVLPTPNNVDVYGGESNVAVMAFEVEAKDSDLTIQRVDIELNKPRAWRFINNIALYDGSNAVKGVDVDRDTVTESAGVSRVRLSGLNIKVTKDSKKTLTVKVGTDARPAADDAVVMTIPEGGVRAVDSAGINQTDGNISRTFNVQSDAEAAKVEFKLNTNSPKEGIALIDENSSTEIELLKADLVVTKGDVDVEKLVFDLTGDLTDVQAVKLYDGTTVIGNVEATTATTAVVFSDLDLNIKSGTTKTLTLKAEIAADADRNNRKSFCDN
ncbi:MAG: peptidoglycan-binding domain-containing protein [Minisyncoccales bacterium]